MKFLIRKYYFILDMYRQTYRKKCSDTQKSNPSGKSKARQSSARVLYLIVALFIFASCEKETQTQLPPSIQLIQKPGNVSSDTTFAFGDLMTFTIQATGGSANLTNLYVIRDGDRMIQTRALDTSMNIFNFEINKSFTKNLADWEIFTFVIRDKNRLSDSVSIFIHRDTTADFGPIRFLESEILSAQNMGIPGSFFSFVDGVLDLNQAMQKQEFIDLLYYYYGEDENVIASPGANVESGVFEGDLQDWTIRRTTRFIELDLPAEEFYAAENDSLLVVSYIEGSGKRKAKNLTSGKIFSFKTQDSKFGIFRVLEVEGSDAGTIKYDIKIQDK